MREESHLEDMRSAIRGDFERLAERRGDQELMRVEAEPDTPAEAPHEDAADSRSAPEEQRRSWLSRFVSP